MSNEISRKEVEMGLSQGALVLVEALPPNRDADIVVYCSGPSCQSSHVAKKKLTDLGYSRVRVFSGGKSEWTEAGNQLEAA